MADAIDTARRLSVDLSPVILKSGSLADSLGWLVEEMRDRYGLLVKVNADGDLPKLDEHLRVLVFESVREILFNVVKHSDILQAEVSMAPRNGNLRIEITDHGKGFDAEAVMNNPKSTHGLLDIRNRLNLLGGSMQVLSQPADGTQVIIEIPV